MNILSNILGKKKNNKPIFLNEFVGYDENRQVRALQELIPQVNDEQKKLLENELKLIKIGLTGERNIKHELENSYMNIVCLHDIRLEYKGLTAQMDFIVIGESFICVIESKRLVGDIDINNDGDFTRIYKNYDGKITRKEGMYSPVSQNEKHVKLLKNMLLDNKIIRTRQIYSLVVSANEKTIINKQFAPKGIKDIIIKHDQLTKRLENIAAMDTDYSSNPKKLLNIGKFIYDNSKDKDYDYISKFNLNIINPTVDEGELNIKEDEEITVDLIPNLECREMEENISNEKQTNYKKISVNFDISLLDNLKQYRKEKSKELNIDLGFVFSNKQLEDIVEIKPINKEMFLSISGLGEKKFELYAEDIFFFINSFEDNNKTSTSNEDLVTLLKEYRKKKSKELNIDLGFVFSNKQLDDLIELKPKTKDEFLSISGFGEKKYETIGEELISLLNSK